MAKIFSYQSLEMTICLGADGLRASVRALGQMEMIMGNVSRRQALGIGSTLLVLPAFSTGSVAARPDAASNASARLSELERAHGGRLGVAVLNLATGARAGNRLDERFLICSTFKTLLTAFILARVDRGEEKLDRRIVFTKDDLVIWAPITETRVGGSGMTVAELCEATVTLSDNAAANLLLASFGGPAALTAFVRGVGDQTTRLDRIEPALNEHDTPGDVRDTTTPAAILETLRKLVFGDILSKTSRAQLLAWHINNKTGDKRLRAGFPADWVVGCKTGTNGTGNSNHVGVAWSPDRGAIIVTAYCEMPSISGEKRDAVLAEVGRIAAGV